MMNQGNVQIRAETLHGVESRIEASTADPELRVVVVALAEQGAVYGKDADLAAANVDDFGRAAGRSLTELPDIVKVMIVPLDECALLLCDVDLGEVRGEVGVCLLSCGEGSGKADTQGSIDVVVAGNDVQVPLVDARGDELSS
jgi:hypothetical protein